MVIPSFVTTTKIVLDKEKRAFEKEIDFELEIKKIKEDLDYQKGFLKSVNFKLENKRFTDNAPKAVVQNEIKKKNDVISKIFILEERLKKLEG